ncbi:MAG TPA: KTSC domain-containing protein [Polyangiaceae bacterium]|nr:KTSC domain-containing protein [Polyangiaceae bacterium]
MSSAGYDVETRVLEIEFSSGRVYRFADVPSSVWEWLVRVPNKGAYVARNLTGKYAFEDLTALDASAPQVDLEALLEASLSTDGS